jgi:hypothetical protein
MTEENKDDQTDTVYIYNLKQGGGGGADTYITSWLFAQFL